MSYHGLGAVKMITDEWGLDRLHPFSGEGLLYALRINALWNTPPATADALLRIAQVAVEGARQADYTFNVQAVLVDPSDPSRVDVVVEPAEDQFVRATGWATLQEKVTGELLRTALASNVSSVGVASLSEGDGKQFAPQGGIAPLYVCGAKACSPTKAASNPHPRQILSGSVDDLANARPLSLAVAIGGGVPSWVWPTLLLLGLGAWWSTSRGSGSAYYRNSCGSCPGDKPPGRRW